MIKETKGKMLIMTHRRKGRHCNIKKISIILLNSTDVITTSAAATEFSLLKTTVAGNEGENYASQPVSVYDN